MKSEKNTIRELNTLIASVFRLLPPIASASASTELNKYPPGAKNIPNKRIIIGPIPHDICEIQIFRPRLLTSELSEI